VISRSVLDPSGGQCIRIAAVSTVSAGVLTAVIRCSSDGARSLAIQAACPMGTMRMGWAAGWRRGGPSPGVSVRSSRRMIRGLSRPDRIARAVWSSAAMRAASW